MNKQDIEQTIANVEQQLALLKAELLKQDVPEPLKKWERKGDWVLFGNGEIAKFIQNAWTRDGGLLTQGRTYQTREAAKSVQPHDALYGLLCGLACELNPSGRAGGRYRLCFDKDLKQWESYTSSYVVRVDDLFEDEISGKKAAEILNREGIKPPQTGGAE